MCLWCHVSMLIQLLILVLEKAKVLMVSILLVYVSKMTRSRQKMQ